MRSIFRLLWVASSLICSGLGAAEPQSVRDGTHDFDFSAGEWHTHVVRILDPFSGGTHSVTLDGTKTARPIWNGRAWIEEIEADGPDGHWEGATLLTYSHKTGEWSQTYFDNESGIQAPSVGRFDGSRGEFYSIGEFQGRTVLERGVWSKVSADSHRYEIFLSQDGGRSWALRFKADLTRPKSEARP